MARCVLAVSERSMASQWVFPLSLLQLLSTSDAFMRKPVDIPLQRVTSLLMWVGISAVRRVLPQIPPDNRRPYVTGAGRSPT
jgi:hypothetical protein